MRIHRSLGGVVGMVALAVLSTGCVSQEKYNALRLERDGLNEQLARAQSDSSSAQAKAASWKSQLEQILNNGSGVTAMLKNAQDQNTTLQQELADVRAKYNDALARMGTSGPLPQELTNELTTFADQNPDLVEFDAKRGTVKFKSDLTFDSGDASLKDPAKTAIGRFATILNSPAARGYELLVAGHADNQKVSSGTQSRGHKDNWHLSSHRALSVADALQKTGVESKRIGAVGYGEYRPIAPNDSKQNMAMNRRVEVLILPTQIADSTPANAAAPANAAPANERAAVEVNNDAALNK